jgi:putative ABC transport system permease protein
LSESTALRYFGESNAVGRTLSVFQPPIELQVSGVIEDLPHNTHLQIDLMTSLRGLASEVLESLGGNCFHTYARLAEGAEIGAIQSRSAAFYDERVGDGASRVRDFTVIPVTDIHLLAGREGELKTPGSIRTVYAFAAIAMIVLLIACLNFVNLATARAVERAKEVGVRKAIGGSRAQLTTQFLGESILVTSIATVLAYVITAAALGPFAAFVERGIGVRDLASSGLVAALLGAIVVVGIVAGGYPAFFLSEFRPVRVLRGDVTRGRGGAALRRLLVAFQFSIAIALMIATAIVFQQERFARFFDLGYDKNQVVILAGSPNSGLGSQWESMKRQWLELREVRAVTASAVTPGTASPLQVTVRAAGDDGLGFLTQLMLIDFGFFELYDIDLVAGRLPDAARRDQEVGVEPGAARRGAGQGPPLPFVLSELTVERLGWTPEDAIGRPIDVARTGVVIGVVEDVYLESVRDALAPVIYLIPATQRFSDLREASVRVSGADLDRTLAEVDAIWQRLGPGTPVMRRFLDDDFEALYRGERRQAQLLALFSLLGILIACLGLYGLASFSTTRRTKEIGIRKTLGASVPEIVRLFTTEFGVLVLLANVVAWPVAYFAMQRWLSGFAYRIELGPFVFVASAALALAVALLTVAAVATRAARAKPVEALRTE